MTEMEKQTLVLKRMTDNGLLTSPQMALGEDGIGLVKAMEGILHILFQQITTAMVQMI